MFVLIQFIAIIILFSTRGRGINLSIINSYYNFFGFFYNNILVDQIRHFVMVTQVSWISSLHLFSLLSLHHFVFTDDTVKLEFNSNSEFDSIHFDSKNSAERNRIFNFFSNIGTISFKFDSIRIESKMWKKIVRTNF